ncbi:hypothetical protein OHV08_00895 [Streptomyces canus]|uniref:hypothetical protein n=1 Tax=Streptomyces canus TaxID=58343 RepID=UPI00324498C2
MRRQLVHDAHQLLDIGPQPGEPYTAVPAPAHTPASALYLARCAGCGALYTHPWRRASPSTHAA